jgi:hypothetical protein
MIKAISIWAVESSPTASGATNTTTGQLPVPFPWYIFNHLCAALGQMRTTMQALTEVIQEQ